MRKVAVRSTLYKEKPLIGQITKTGRADIQIDWYIGTYSGTWKPWKGREGGKTVTYMETINRNDVIRKVTFTRSMRLSTATTATLKTLYC